MSSDEGKPPDEAQSTVDTLESFPAIENVAMSTEINPCVTITEEAASSVTNLSDAEPGAGFTETTEAETNDPPANVPISNNFPCVDDIETTAAEVLSLQSGAQDSSVPSPANAPSPYADLVGLDSFDLPPGGDSPAASATPENTAVSDDQGDQEQLPTASGGIDEIATPAENDDAATTMTAEKVEGEPDEDDDADHDNDDDVPELEFHDEFATGRFDDRFHHPIGHPLGPLPDEEYFADAMAIPSRIQELPSDSESDEMPWRKGEEQRWRKSEEYAWGKGERGGRHKPPDRQSRYPFLKDGVIGSMLFDSDIPPPQDLNVGSYLSEVMGPGANAQSASNVDYYSSGSEFEADVLDSDNDEDYDGDDEDVDQDEFISGNEEGVLEEEEEDDEQKQRIAILRQRTAIVGELSSILSLQVEALVRMWPVLVKKLEPSKVLDLLFLCGTLKEQEVVQVRKLSTPEDKKAAVRFLLGIMRRRPVLIDFLFRIIIEEQPHLKKYVLKKLREQYGKVNITELQVLADSVGQLANSGISVDYNPVEDMLELLGTNVEILNQTDILKSRNEAERKPREVAEKPKSEWKTIVRQNFAYLNSRVDGRELAARCVEKELLAQEDFDRILPQMGEDNQIDVLYRVVRNTGPSGYKLFIDILKSFGDRYREVHHHLFRYAKKLKDEEKKKAEEKAKEDAESKTGNDNGLGKCPELCEPFVGRDSLVQLILDKMSEMGGEEQERRILALRGPYGCGKSSIAVSVARKLIADAATPVHFVPLRGCITCPLVVRRIIHMISPSCIGNSCKTLAEEVCLLDDNAVVILDNLEDCSFSPGSATTQPSPADFSVDEMLKILLENHESVRVLVTCRFRVTAEDASIIDMEVPPLENAACYSLLRTLSPCLSRRETREVAAFSAGIPMAVHLLAALAKYHPNTMSEVVAEAAERCIDMNNATWTQTDHLLYILVELISDQLAEHLGVTFGSLCIFHAAFSSTALLHVLHLKEHLLLSRHITSELKRRCLIDEDTLLGRLVMQPIALKHGFASLEDREHRVFRRIFVNFYFNMLNYVRTLSPATQYEVDAVQEHFCLDYPHFLRSYRYSTDIRDHEIFNDPITYNILALAFPTDTTYNCLRRGAYLSTVAGNQFLQCATHLTLAYFEELTHEWERALHTLGTVIRGIIDFVRKPDVAPAECVKYHELMYFCRLLERRFKLRLGVFSGDEAKMAAIAAYREYHTVKAQETPVNLLTDLDTVACAGFWRQVPDVLAKLLDAVRIGMLRVEVPKDEKEIKEVKELKENQSDVPEALKIAMTKFAGDGMVVLIAFVSVALRHPETIPPPGDVLKVCSRLRRVGLLLQYTDQRDATTELSKRWYNMYYDQNTAVDGIPFQQLFTAITGSRRYTEFPTDPLVMGPSTGLPDWLMSMPPHYPIRLYMEANVYDQTPESEEYFNQRMLQLTEDEQKVILLLNKAWQHEHYLLTPFLEEWERKFGDGEAWMVVKIESIPFYGTEIVNYVTLLAVQLAAQASERGLTDDELVALFRFCRVANCCGLCLQFKAPNTKMHYCQRCTVVLYCDRQCQKKHFHTHKKVCARLNQIKRKAQV